MKSKKLVIFDMGNTLLNFHSGKHTDEEKDLLGIGYMQEYLLKNHGCYISKDKLIRDFLDNWYSDFYLRKQLIELDVKEYLKPVLEMCKLELQDDEYIALMSEFYKAYKEEVVLSNEAIDILCHLQEKGVKIAVASNCILFDEIYMQIFEEQGIGKYIDKYVFSYSRGYRKPDLRIFEEILNHFRVSSHEALMIGDSLEADIIPAKKLGMETVWINRKSDESCNFADLEVLYFKDMKKNIIR